MKINMEKCIGQYKNNIYVIVYNITRIKYLNEAVSIAINLQKAVIWLLF